MGPKISSKLVSSEFFVLWGFLSQGYIVFKYFHFISLDVEKIVL